jgi:hypothetical protein
VRVDSLTDFRPPSLGRATQCAQTLTRVRVHSKADP